MITIVIPELPSDYSRPYPKLTLTCSLEEMRTTARALPELARDYTGPICYRLDDWNGDNQYQWLSLKEAIMAGLDGYMTILGYLCPGYATVIDSDVYKHRHWVRSKWLYHIERSLWEQLGECQT